MVFITPVYRVLECRNRERGVTIYPDVFDRIRKLTAKVSYNYPDAVSADIASIKACAVLEKLQTVLPRSRSPT